MGKALQPSWIARACPTCIVMMTLAFCITPGRAFSPADEARPGGEQSPAQPGRAKSADCCAPAKGEQRRYVRTVADYTPPDVRLIDEHARQTTLSAALAKKPLVVLQFAYTSCSTVCPVATGTVAAARRELGDDAGRVRWITITIDPEHDTSERLRTFAEDFGADPNWSLYTGRLDDIVRLQKAFDAYPGNKARHEPLTFLKTGEGDRWVRLAGVGSAKELAREIRPLLDARKR